MGSFRIREDAISWLSDVQKTLPAGSIFDLYYFCAIAGLTTGHGVEHSGSSREMVDYFVSDYKPAANFIIAMLVVAELKKARVELTEESEVRTIFRNLVDGQGENGLTAEGMQRLNAYANSGYEYLAENCEQRPQSAEEFLRTFAELIGQAVPSGPFAAV
jgi:hypothetical protein